ncbi:NAD+ synthase [Thermogemmatispora tikiterensis]|uniref:Glutamine-dependent NAD(+) synthetase n=1 Tax=Thermogemmatispora tikiterensis TaxID=1825093 RepID=A0A328VFQ8_9CHLR|nr:NAD+ synthase [Thermogemmatispora tikiterensis]RAQ96327.1 NAD+ synthase [Thermogemmatispora tikiterensis]
MHIVPLRIALAQINVTVGDLDGNAEKIWTAMREAHQAGAHIVCTPELALTGYPPEDLLLKPGFVSANLRRLQWLIERSQELPGLTAVIGYVDRDEDIYNAAAVIGDGRLYGIYHKHYLPNYGVFDEYRYFQAGRAAPLFLINGVHVGITICEDIWYPTGPLTLQAHAGAEVIININGSPYHAGKRHFREQMLATRAADNGLIVAYLNLVGGQDELVFDGGSMVFNEQGRLIARAKQFEEDLLVVDLDVASVFRSRLHDPRRRQERLELRPEEVPVIVVSSEITPPPTLDGCPLLGTGQRIEPALERLAEIYAALVLGTRDYVRKTGFSKAIVGLSGGIDSSLTAVIAADALGPENVLGVSMPSAYSSEGSKTDARQLAENLGIQLITVPIEEIFRTSLRVMAPALGEGDHGLAAENLQARIRGNILMTISNKLGPIVLTTGNKSEMATGYSTLYGDMAGGFAVLKDVPKTLVYELSRYRNSLGERPVIPQAVLEKAPSAELRPGQKDTDSLPPYELLDPILQAYAEEDRSFEEMVAMGFDPALVERVMQLVDRSEYKRRQAPPGVKITPRAFGRDRRLPITNRYRDRPGA